MSLSMCQTLAAEKLKLYRPTMHAELRSAACNRAEAVALTMELPIAKHAFGIVIGQKA
ncbi:MAG: hypothetical protein QOJ51_6645 [Acidobacteriaceae bacterium]|jgi:hypothetical protein|nr:hypothetical protein [Acidobacteriaceae bacterium]MDX6464268.1 hypothetical protein [Acidobacteriaceae bacterium]MEA2263820.1 hypothetical protein [Acidobacteriaceae bacterium]